MFLHMMGSLKTVPPRMLRMVPFGDFHIFFNLNSAHNQGRHMDTHTTIRRALPKNSTITLSLSFTNPSLPDCTSPHQSLSPSPPLPSPPSLTNHSPSLPPSLTNHSLLVWSDGGTLNPNVVLPYGLSTLHSHCTHTHTHRHEVVCECVVERKELEVTDRQIRM